MSLSSPPTLQHSEPPPTRHKVSWVQTPCVPHYAQFQHNTSQPPITNQPDNVLDTHVHQSKTRGTCRIPASDQHAVPRACSNLPDSRPFPSQSFPEPPPCPPAPPPYPPLWRGSCKMQRSNLRPFNKPTIPPWKRATLHPSFPQDAPPIPPPPPECSTTATAAPVLPSSAASTGCSLGYKPLGRSIAERYSWDPQATASTSYTGHPSSFGVRYNAIPGSAYGRSDECSSYSSQSSLPASQAEQRSVPPPPPPPPPEFSDINHGFSPPPPPPMQAASGAQSGRSFFSPRPQPPPSSQPSGGGYQFRLHQSCARSYSLPRTQPPPPPPPPSPHLDNFNVSSHTFSRKAVPPPPPPPPPPPASRHTSAYIPATRRTGALHHCDSCDKDFLSLQKLEQHVEEEHIVCDHPGCTYSAPVHFLEAHKLKHVCNAEGQSIFDDPKETDLWIAARKRNFPSKRSATVEGSSSSNDAGKFSSRKPSSQAATQPCSAIERLLRSRFDPRERRCMMDSGFASFSAFVPNLRELLKRQRRWRLHENKHRLPGTSDGKFRRRPGQTFTTTELLRDFPICEHFLKYKSCKWSPCHYSHDVAAYRRWKLERNLRGFDIPMRPPIAYQLLLPDIRKAEDRVLEALRYIAAHNFFLDKPDDEAPSTQDNGRSILLDPLSASTKDILDHVITIGDDGDEEDNDCDSDVITLFDDEDEDDVPE